MQVVHSNRTFYWVALVIFLGLIFALMFAVSSPMRQGRGGDQFDSARVVWSAKSGKPVPDDFLYVFYPHDEKVAIIDGDGKEIGVYLDRAFWCSEEELRQGETLGVYVGDKEYRVPMSRVTANPDLPNRATLEAYWNKVIRSWGTGDETDWRRAEVKFERLSPTSCRVILTRIDEQADTDYFIYVVDSDRLIPEEWRFDRILSHWF